MDDECTQTNPPPKGFDFQPEEHADLETREEVVCYVNPESVGGVEEVSPSRKKMR